MIAHDVRLACRNLGRAPGFTATAVLTLALGIAGTTAMFALVEGVLLRPLPVADPDRLLVAWTEVGSTRLSHWPFLAVDVDVIGRASRVLERVAGVGYNGAQAEVAVEGQSASYIRVAPVTGEFFGVLGVKTILGRAFDRLDDVRGAENVMVLTHALWQRRYGGSQDAIGRRLILAERPFTIVGVMPPDVEYPRGVEAWTTVAALTTTLTNPAFRIDIDLIARLRRGATIDQAASELQALTARIEADAPANDERPRGLTPAVHPYEELVVGDVRMAMLIMFGAVALVFLIASANVANLLLMRGEARRGELAVRAALGATRGRLALQLVAESVVLALAAGALALAVTWSSLQALLVFVPGGLPRVESVRVDAGVVAFATVVACLVVALAGVVPALMATRDDMASHLRGAARVVGSARRGRRTLVVAQVALAVMVVAAAGLLIQTLVRLQTVDMGLAAPRLVFVELVLPQAKYRDRTRHIQFLDAVVAQLEATPGILGATPVNTPPFAGTGGWDASTFTVEGQRADRAANPSLNVEAIHPNYFATFEIAIRGRSFVDTDREGALNVAIVSEDVAARAWPGENPLGKRLKIGGLESTDGWRTVVGVAAVTRYRELAVPRPTLYLPARQFIVSAQRLVLRTTSPVAVAARLARDRIRASDPDVQVMRVAPFADLLDTPLARPRFNAFVIGMFGVAALTLAAIGLYAVVAASVWQRFAEIGIRIALGATASDVRRLVLGEGLRLACIGAVIGLGGAIAAARVLRGLLFAVHPLDPSAMIAAALLLVGVSVAAADLPARRAARVDPIDSLRAE